MPNIDTTRASKSRLKESFFSSINFIIQNNIFIEAFGGSGSMGLEALSRGAKKSYFIEKDKNAFKVLSENIKNIDEKNSKIFLGDTFEILPKILKELRLSEDAKLIIYLDPPFDFRENMQGIYQKCFDIFENLKENKNIEILCFEHFSNFNMPEKIQNFEILKSKKFGKSTLTYYGLEND